MKRNCPKHSGIPIFQAFNFSNLPIWNQKSFHSLQLNTVISPPISHTTGFFKPIYFSLRGLRNQDSTVYNVRYLLNISTWSSGQEIWTTQCLEGRITLTWYDIFNAISPILMTLEEKLVQQDLSLLKQLFWKMSGLSLLRAKTFSTCHGWVCLMGPWLVLILRVKLPVVDAIHSKGNMFVTGVKLQVTRYLMRALTVFAKWQN